VGDLRDPAPPVDLRRFARIVRARRCRAAASFAGVQALLVAALPCLFAAWLVPSWAAKVAAGWLLLGGLAAGRAAVQAWSMRDAALLRGAADTPAEQQLLAEVGDELATWLERPVDAAPMRAWLGADVQNKLPQVSDRAYQRLGRRRHGRIAWLVPLLALLLVVAAWLTDWLSPPWPGVLGGRRTEPTAGDGAGDREAGGEARRPGGDQPIAGVRPSPPGPPPPPSPSETPPPTTEPPAPLLDLPTQQRFVVPEFVGDGPTRRARMHAAEVEQGRSGSAATADGAGGVVQVPPPSPREQFARAAERALASRHVPPAEQAIVRRFFDALQQAAR